MKTLLLSLLLSGAQAQDVALEPEPALQAAIRHAVHTTEPDERREALDRLRRLGGADFQALVPQLLHFSSRATDTREGMALGVLVEALRIPDDALVRALVPLFETGDAALRRDVAGALAGVEHETVDRPPSLQPYRPFVEAALREGREPPPGLVRYLYGRHPGAALLLLARAHRPAPSELREVLWAEHVVADTLWKQRFGFLARDEAEPAAREQLELLSRSPRWWARLWVAETMRAEASLRDAETLRRLADDRHALVRAAAANPANR